MTEKITKNGYRAGVDGRLMVTLCVFLAVGAARRAVKLLESAGFSELAKQVRASLDAYEAHQPYREGS